MITTTCVVRKSSKVRCFVGTSWFPTIPCYQLMQRCTCINFAVALVVMGLDFSYREVKTPPSKFWSREMLRSLSGCGIRCPKGIAKREEEREHL